MIKRLLTFLLVAIMVVLFLSVTALADGEVCQIGSEKYASVTAALNAAHTSETAETPTKIKLIANTNENITISAGRYITLDLNGFVLKGIGNTSVIRNEGTLTIIDSNPSVVHYYTVDSNHKWVWDDSTTTGATNYSALTARPTANDVIAVSGGVITGGYSTAEDGGGGICSSGDLTLNGGNVIGNEITRYGGGISITNYKTATINGGRILGNITTGTDSYTGNGGGIAVGYGMWDGTIIIINSGEVCFNTATRYGGGVYNNTGSVTVTGGVIAYNRAVNNGGGGLCSDATMKLFGGTVIKNTAKQKGGGMYHNCTSFYLGGDVIIEDNITEGDVTSNVYFNNSTNSTKVSFDETHLPQQGMNIGVTLSSPPAAGEGKLFTNGSNADYSAYFFSDSTAYYVNLVDGTTKYLELRALAPGNYAINVIPPKNGTVTVSPKEAAKGTEITLTVVPNEGYELESLVYTDSSEHDILSTKSFAMPAANVTVTAKFKQLVVATPVANPVAGIYTSAKTVTLSTTTEGADIYYTTDGTDPTTSSTKYTAAIAVNNSMTIKAIAVKENWANSGILTADYTITGTVATPVASPGSGTYEGEQTVYLSTITEGAEIYYTTDGSTPTADSTRYTAPISVTENTVIKAIAIIDNWIASEVLEASYTINYPVIKVEVSPDAINMKPGETQKISIKITPDNATDQTLTVTMDQEGIVTIAEDGTVTALKDGIVKVTFTTSNGVSGSCVITVKTDPIQYKIIQGADQTVFTNANQAVFASNADFSKFKSVKVDGVEVAKKYYTAASGSTVITFNKEFVSNKLKVGTHSIEIVSTDGSAKANFTVAKPLPKTGDTATPFLWLGICMLTIFSILMLHKKAYRN